MAALLVENSNYGGMQGGEGLDELLNSWARSPGQRVLRSDDDGLGPTPAHDGLGDSFSLDELLMGPSPMGKGGNAVGLPRASAAAPAAQQQQQQQQQQQLGGSSDVPPYLVLPNVSSGLANGGMQLELPPFMGAAHPPNGGSPYLHPPALGGLPPVGSVLSNMAAASSQQRSLSDGGDGQPAKKRRGPRPRLFKKHACQCDGCSVDLAPLSFYLQRNHICPDHLKADSYMVKGVPSRFCQRCGQGHPLTEFEGSKRSCRKALERHNQRRRDKQAASTVTGTSGPSTSALGPGGSAEVQLQLQLQAAQQAAALAAHQQVQQQQQQADAMVNGWLDGAFDDVQGPFQQAQQQQLEPQQLEPQQGGEAASLPNGLPNSLPHGLPNGLAATGLETTGSVTLPPVWQQRPPPLGPSPLGPPAASHHQAQAAAATAQQQAQQLQPVPKEEQWVMLPRHLIEQHAPHLLASAMMLSGSGGLQASPQLQQQHQASPQLQQQHQASQQLQQQHQVSQQQMQQEQMQQQQMQQQQMQQQQMQQQQLQRLQSQTSMLPPHPPQQQQQQQQQTSQQQQQRRQQQLLWPPKPEAAAFDLLDEPFNLLFGDEFGGSGI